MWSPFRSWPSPRHRPPRRRASIALLAGILLAAAAPAPAAAQPCPGDCNGDAAVTVEEIVTVVNIALGTAAIAQCPAADTDGNGEASVDELVTMINLALNGCPPVEPLPEDWEEAVDAGDFGWVMSGWGPGDGSLWAVGGGLFEGRILRRQRGTWQRVDPGLSFELLNWVHGTSASDVFFGGNEGVILHWDGRRWEKQETPTFLPVWGLWANAPDDVWAVGGDNNARTPPLVMRYDGSRWQVAAIPTLARPRVHAFFKVWGSAADDVWMVGQNGAILHWDGTAFTEFGAGVSQDLIGIWGTGPDNVVTVGGRGTAEMARWDGSRWTRAPASALPGLNGVWLRRPDVAHVVGITGTVLRVDPATFTVLDRAEPAPTGLDLHAVFGDASGEIFAFGANFVLPERGTVLHRGLSDDE